MDQRDSELAELQRRIASRLQGKGPANIETLATELKTPQPTIWLALQKLREGKAQIVEFHPDGLWELVGIYRRNKREEK